MSQEHNDPPISRDDRDPEDRDDAVRAELAVLREENERLRAEYRRARQHQHRQSALALAGIGILASLGGVVFTSLREVLLVLGAIGVFGAVLTYYLTPERVTTASVLDSVQQTHADTLTHLVDELGLQDDRIYLPTTDASTQARLFIPQHAQYTIPEDRTGLFVTQDTAGERGLCLPAVGSHLMDTLEPATSTEETPGGALALATDSLVEQFEVVDAASYDRNEGTATVTVTAPRPRDLGAIDHPVVSVCGVLLATTLETPVEVGAVGDNRVTFTWTADTADD